MSTPEPALRCLPLGAGVQSTTLLPLLAQGAIPTFDCALFADTGREPERVYDHLESLEHIATEAGIPVIRVNTGNIRDDALDERHRFASMPLFLRGPQRQRGMAHRQRTGEYKVRPLKRQARRLLGYPHPTRVPDQVHATQAIVISADEVHRAKDTDAIDFDAAIRHGHPAAATRGMPLCGTYYPNSSRRPLSEVDLGIDNGPEPEGCSPWSCRGDADQGPALGGDAE